MEQENYFGDMECESRARKCLTVIIYDITSNKQRTRMVKLLESFGRRVQKSAFEAWLDYKSYSRLCARIERLITSEDHVKIYRLSGAAETKAWGEIPDFDHEGIIII